MKIKIRVFALLMLCCSAAFAQKQNVYFITDAGKHVSTKDSADYVRVISAPDSGSVLFNITEYYAKTGKVRFVGKNKFADHLYLQGQSISYYPSGKKKLMGSYENDALDGDVYQYYPNGKLYSVLKIVSGQSSIIACNDSTGKPLLVGGNGHFIVLDDDLKQIVAQGEVVNGKPDGYWIRKQMFTDKQGLADSTVFKDKYVSGNYAGSSNITPAVLAEGVVEFKAVEIQPDFPGGELALAKFMQRNIRYPAAAKENNITGKVYLQFIVEKDGSLTDIIAIRSPSDVLSQEGIRVMLLSPKWKVGMLDGKPVRVKFTMPINFSLGNK